MSYSLLIAFVLFATVMFFTPGPNNIMTEARARELEGLGH